MRAFRAEPRVLIALAALGLAAALGAVVALGMATDPREARALRTQGMIVAVTHSGEQPVLGPNWKKWLRPLSPVSKGFPVPPGPPPPLLMWVNLSREPLYLLDGDPGVNLTLTDDSGSSLQTNSGQDGYWQEEIVAGMQLFAFPIPRFPRRGRHIRLHVDASTEGNVQAPQPDLEVANPTPGPFPVWAPEALPARRRSGDLEVALERFETGCASPAGPTSTVPQTQFELSVTEGWRRTREWSVRQGSLTDPTGNAWSIPQSSPPANDGRVLAGVRWRVPAEEPAYRVRLELARTRNLPPADVWTVRPFAYGRGMPANLRHVLHGCTVEVSELSLIQPTPGAPGTAEASVQLSGPAAGFCLVAEIWAGGQWRELEVFQEAGKAEVFGSDLPGMAGPVRLRLALSPRRVFEFRAHASRAGS